MIIIYYVHGETRIPRYACAGETQYPTQLVRRKCTTVTRSDGGEDGVIFSVRHPVLTGAYPEGVDDRGAECATQMYSAYRPFPSSIICFIKLVITRDHYNHSI